MATATSSAPASSREDFAAMLEESFTYVNLKGEQSTYRFADILVHVVNHGTYHRGQLGHLLRDLGLTPPSTDYLIFRRDKI